MTTPTDTSISLGALWHPELWNEEHWDRDIARMKELGITCVRVFERAWGRFEPTEWQYDFDWSVRVLDRLRDAGIAAIVCTCTGAPPSWMITRYPEILRTNADSRRAQPAQPRAASMVSSRYREFCSRIVDQMIHAFRGHDAVAGWLIDSRIGGADFGAESRRAFHTWLSGRLGSIEQLNRTWGFDYGSQSCEYFDQVPIPQTVIGSGPIPPDRRPHPSLAINFQRFINDQWSSYIHPQVEIIRGVFEKPIAAIMTAGEWSMNWFRLNHLLDRVTVGVACVEQTAGQMQMHLDRARAEKPGTPFWVTDVSPNWQADGAARRLQDPLQVRSLVWLSVLSGANGVMFQNLRAHAAGLQMLDGALVTAAGKLAPNHDAISRASTQLREQSAWLAAHPPLEARVGIIVSNESAWMFSIDPMEADLDYQTVWRDEFYQPLVRSHYWRDVIDQTQDFCPYQVLVLPLLPVLYQQTLERLKKWVEDGGCLLVGPMTALRNDQGSAFTDQELGGLETLIGGASAMRFPTRNPIVIKWEPHGTGGGEGDKGTDQSAIGNPQSAIPQDSELSTQDSSAPALADPQSALGDPDAALGISQSASPQDSSTVPDSTAHGWCEAFEPTTAQALARYRGGWGDGKAAVLLHRVGKGTVITIGARVDPATYLDLVGALCDIANVKPLVEGSPGVIVIPRMNPDTSIAGYGLVNTTDQPQAITLPSAGIDRITGNLLEAQMTLEPHEVALVEVQPAPDMAAT